MAATELEGVPRHLWSIPGIIPLALSSWMWHVTRWGALFCCTYLMTELNGAPVLNQLVGASVFAPLLLGGIGAGTLSNRFDRKALILCTEVSLLPISVAMYLLVATDAIRTWMIFPYAMAVGLGGLVSVLAQRPLSYEIGGPRFATQALALEMAGSASSSVAGTLLGGTIIQTVGTSAAFGLLVVPLALSALLLLRVRVPDRNRTESPLHPRACRGPRRRRPRQPLTSVLISVLGVTVVLNLFYAPFTPLIPVMAERLDATALLTGALAASSGLGQFCGGLWFGAHPVAHRGRLYAFGVGAGLLGLIFFANAPNLPLASLALVLGGIGHGGFNVMQSVLVIEAVEPHQRGMALGKLSMAIGVMPIGQITCGLIAGVIGAPGAITVTATAGLLVLVGWLRWRPQVLDVVAPERPVGIPAPNPAERTGTPLPLPTEV